ncbi:hypothetical protein BDM02DRAFT_3156773 [Thelephora ganbajun]|uniref:Uncharacterized protein n=1 Tax=Thelephora ganbajun TaxID=370292 RepID=A0ACB6Z8P2_THEGA|nr:hypothetical protein BDM02DRAFT_3156773 [Thelephora ganbajun]
MPPPQGDSTNTPEWFCTCGKCGRRGKALTRATWYRHNPSGIKAKYGALTDKEMEASQKAYASARKNIQERFPESEMLSYDQVKQRVSNLSGVFTWKHDMCINSCAAFTGPFAHLEKCPCCHKSCYDEDELRKSNSKNKVPRKVFTMFPLGPQLQSCWKSPHMAQQMLYRRDKTRDLLQKRNQGEDYIYDDIFCGLDYLDAAKAGDIKDYNMVVMLSIDGAQLYCNKKLDCWIYIWIILDLAPDQRYKIRNIIPGSVIPGPKNSKHLNSFLFPGLAHVSALQKEGMRIWDGCNGVDTLSFLILLLILADAVAMAELSSSVGHHGKKGCQIFCGFFGCNKPGGPHYYPVLLQPLDSDVVGSNHLDFDINNLSEASIFDGTPRILEPPTCFPGDIMHQPLWKGDGSTDGNVWKTHGQAVADAAPYFPCSFDCTPRNPAKKLSSGYKAWELLLYFYGLGPEAYYKHYCKLIISPEQLQLAHWSLLEWVLEFKHLYYCWKTEHLHFVRQCVHSLVHLAPETLCIGPPSLLAQWTMEHQPSNPFANLTEQAKKVVEVNSIIIKKDPHGSIDIGNGYILLGPKDTKGYRLPDTEKDTLVLHQGTIRFAEVQFYFQAIVEGINETLALCSLYSPIDNLCREYSNSALNVCRYEGGNHLVVIWVKSILSVVVMVPFVRQGEQVREFFLVEKFALGVIDTGDIVD